MIKSSHNQLHLTRMLIALFLPYLALSLAQSGFLGLLPFVKEEFALTRTQVGYYSAFFFISASILSVFTGNIVDKLGSKKSILLGISSMGILLFFHGLSTIYNLILLLSLLTGLGYSILTPSAVKAVTINIPPEKRAFSMSITQSGFGLGGILGASMLPFIGEIVGWRIAICIAAVIVLFTGLLVKVLYQENDNNNMKDNSSKDEEDNFREHLFSIIKDKPLLKICILGIVFGVSEGALLAHFVVFLTEDLMIGKITAGLNFAILHLGGMAGLIGWGFISDRFFRRDRHISIFLVGITSGTMYIFFGLFMHYLLFRQNIIPVLSFLFGFLVLGWTGTYLTTVGEEAGNRRAGIATGLALSFVRGTMIIASPLFGRIADFNGCYKNSWLIYGIVIICLSTLFLKRD